MATETKKATTIVDQMFELIDSLPVTIRKCDQEEILRLFNGITILRALTGAGGKVTLTDGSEVDTGKLGLAKTYDSNVKALKQNGMLPDDFPVFFADKDNAGRPRKEVKSINDSIKL